MKESIKWIVTVGLSGILVPVVQYLFNLIPWAKFVGLKNWTWLVAPRFSILWLVIFATIFMLFVRLTKKMFSKTKEEQLKQFNSWNIDEDGLKITWNVGAKDYSGNPFAYNIQIFCTKHGEIPVRMLNGRCPHIDCPNHQKPTFEYLVKNDIESMLLYVQDKLKNGSSK